MVEATSTERRSAPFLVGSTLFPAEPLDPCLLEFEELAFLRDHD